MFEFVLRRDVLPRRRFAPALGIATVFYSGAVAFAVWAESHAGPIDRQDIVIKFVAPPRPVVPRAPPPAPVAPSRLAVARAPTLKAAMTDQPRTVVVQAIVAPTVVPEAKLPEQEPVASTAAGIGDVDEAYEVPAVPGGITDPVVDASVVELVAAAPAFSGRMVPPRFLSGPTPAYTQKAIERDVEGIMEVRCVVAVDGRVRDCRVLKSLPFMDRAVIEALEQRRYEPATLGGRAVDVYYRFRLPFRLADSS